MESLRGQGGEGSAADDEAEPTLAARMGATAERLAELEPRLSAARADEQTALVTQLEREREILTRTQQRQRQLESALAEQERLAEELEVRQSELDAYLASAQLEEVDADFFTLEEARDELDEAVKRADLLDKTRLAALRQKDLAERAVETALRQERRAGDAIARAAGEVEEAAARQNLRESELESAAAQELLRVRVAEVGQAEQKIDVQRLLVSRARARVERLQERVSFAEEDYGKKSAELDAQKATLESRLEKLTDRQARTESNLLRARELQPEGAELSEEKRAELEFYELELSLFQDEIEALENAKDRVDTLRDAWDRRRRLSQSDLEPGECAAWDAEANEWLTDLEVDESIRTPQLETVRAHLQEAQRADDTSPYFDPVARLQESADILSDSLGDIAAARQVIHRLREEIAAETQRIPWGERLRAVGDWVQRMWEYELIPLDDRSITVRKVVLGLTIVFLGGWLARRFSRLLGYWLERRFQIDKGGTAVAQTLTFYALVVLFFLLALKVVNVPLTAFTIFGGAIAIGVGFGSQNLINNFISGLILLMEQPVRVGDLIQVGDLQGNVERIGARSTVVRTGSNIEIVVPNSTFLEKQVVNLTLSEPKVRVHVRVGVAYGSPTREVAKLLRRAAEEHGRILKSPEPIVLFEDFGNDALIFEVHFWIRMRRVMDRRTIESDVRFIVDGLCKGAGITIAFPQRDVHLDTQSPLEVHVMTPEPPAASGLPGVTSSEEA